MHGRFLYLAGLYLTTPVLSGLEPIIGCIILEKTELQHHRSTGERGGYGDLLYWPHRPRRSRRSSAPTLNTPWPRATGLRPLVKGAACSARSWPNYDQSCQFDLHVGRSGPPGAGARFGEGWQPAQRRHRLTLSIHRDSVSLAQRIDLSVTAAFSSSSARALEGSQLL